MGDILFGFRRRPGVTAASPTTSSIAICWKTARWATTRLRRGLAARASLQRLLPDPQPDAHDGAHRGEISRSVARHVGAGAALVSPAASGRRHRHAQQPDARHPASGHRPRHGEDGIRRLQHRHERGPRALRGGLPDHGEGPGGEAFHPSGPLLEHRSSDPSASCSGRQAGALLRGHRQPRERGGDGRARHRAHLPVHVPRRTAGEDSRAMAGARRHTGERRYPSISVKMFIADTDEEARELGRRYYPAYFSLQADHYEADANPWAGIPESPTSAACSRTCANWRTRPSSGRSSIPISWAASRPFASASMRSPDWASYFMVSCATPGTPFALRQQMMTRFAREVCPRYSSAMRRDRVASVSDAPGV